MDYNLPNAAPQHIALGIEDGSGRIVRVAPEILPTHLPKFYFYGQRGDTKERLVTGAGFSARYGSATLESTSPYFNHASALLRTMITASNMCMVKRILPDDIGPRATLRLSLDVLRGPVDQYEREEDGKYRYNDVGEKIATGLKLPKGAQVVWVTEVIEPDAEGETPLGSGAIRDGYQLDAATGKQSKLYPMFEWRVDDFGAFGNNIGVRLFAPMAFDQTPVDSALMQNEKCYPYRLQYLERESEDSIGVLKRTSGGSVSVDVVFKKGVMDRRYRQKVSIHDQAVKGFETRNVPGFQNVPTPFGEFFAYDTNIETLTKEFYDNEVEHRDMFSDFTGEDGEHFRFNIVSGTSSSAVPYHSFILRNDIPEAQSLNRNSVMYAGGASDGTMNNAAFAESVGRELDRYGDIFDPIMEDAYHVESIFYDSGFPLQTKYKIFKMISLRKDTFVVVSTYDVDGLPMNADQESALALSLKTMALQYPESEYFGTKTARACIVGRNAIDIKSDYQERLPMTFELARKAAAMMGAANGRWDTSARFDHGEGAQIEGMVDVNIPYTSVPVRIKDWANGLIWVQRFDTERFSFPQLQTVYEDDTSILNHFITGMVCVELQKIGARLTRYFQGALLSNEQMIQRTERKFREWTVDRFGDMYIVTPQTIIEGQDKERGYSWYTRCDLEGPNSKTVGLFSVRALRLVEAREAAQA